METAPTERQGAGVCFLRQGPGQATLAVPVAQVSGSLRVGNPQVEVVGP